MSRYDAALWQAADAQFASGPSGEHVITIERPVPHVGEAIDGWREYAVRLGMDEGRVASAELYAERVPYRTSAAGPLRWLDVPVTGGMVTLDRDETENAEVSFAELEAES